MNCSYSCVEESDSEKYAYKWVTITKLLKFPCMKETHGRVHNISNHIHPQK
jgi:hypothetical protein